MISLIMLAGGKGERFGGNKCFVSLNGKPVIDYSLSVFEDLVDEIIVVSPKPYKNYLHAKPGRTRGESVLSGLIKSNGDKIIIHEAVRPFITKEIVVKVLLELVSHPSVSTAVPIVDGLLAGDVPITKKGFYLSQTPEAFHRKVLSKAFSVAKEDYRDEVTLVAETLGILPTVVPGVYVNSKITFPQDLPNAEGIMKFRQAPIQSEPNLKGKTIAVYGATGDIGGACVRRLKKLGAKVLTPNWADKVETDGVIYAAGAYREEDEIMGVNFSFPYRLLSKPTAKNYVFLSSAAATYGRKEALYSASKAALNSLIESKHEELANKGVFVNAIAPQRVKGKLQKYFTKASQKNFLEPDYIAEWVCRYLDTKEHGHIIYLRNKL